MTASTSSSAASGFEQLGVEGWLARQCASLSLCRPTPIQSQCIPPILQGSHVLGGAATGSGKTAAFALPILQRLSQELYGIFAVVLTPSRELGYQLADQFIALGAPLRLRTLLVMGGTSHNDQVQAIKSRPHLLVATPGRLCFLFRTFEAEITSALKFLRFLVLDEADRLTEAELGRDVRWLLEYHLKPSARRQVLMFSATLHPRLYATPSSPKAAVRGESRDENDETSWLSLLGIEDPKSLVVVHVSHEDAFHGDAAIGGENRLNTTHKVEADASSAYRIPSTLQNTYLFLPNMVKLPYLVATLRALGKDQMTIVFANSCFRAELVRLVLQLLGFPVCSLHSSLQSQQRLNNLAMFKAGISKVLVATDIASRGLDIPEVGVVLHYDMPKQAESFVHRVGRTARAGRRGLSVAMVTERDISLVKHVERQLGTTLVAWTRTEGEENGVEQEMGSSKNKKANSAPMEKKKRNSAAGTPFVEEEEVVKILDEVSEAKVTALQQVTEKLSSRTQTLKQQASEKKAAQLESRLQKSVESRALREEKKSEMKKVRKAIQDESPVETGKTIEGVQQTPLEESTKKPRASAEPNGKGKRKRLRKDMESSTAGGKRKKHM